MKRNWRDPSARRRERLIRFGMRNTSQIWLAVTIIMAAALLFGGRALVIAIGDRIPQRNSVVRPVVAAPIGPLLLQEEQPPYLANLPFASLNAQNSRPIVEWQPDELKQDGEMFWWVNLLSHRMMNVDQKIVFPVKREIDRILYQPGGLRQNAPMTYRLMEQEFNGNDGQKLLIRAALGKNGLTYMEIVQPNASDVKITFNDTLLSMAVGAGRSVISQLRYNQTYAEDQRIGLRLDIPADLDPEPKHIYIQGLICHVVYHDRLSARLLVVLYNPVAKSISGFAVLPAN